MTLRELILSPDATIDQLAAYLDGLSADDRKAEVVGLRKSHQKALWLKAASAPPLEMSHFVPDGVAPLTEVIHHGKNTLPLFTRFQKRFWFSTFGPGPEAFGYNEGSTRRLIGPGYFVIQSTAGNPEWEKLGALVVNYYRVPSVPVVSTWPPIVPNSKGLQMFVYNNTRDFMRRVSQHVSIGTAYKGDKALGAWFVLCREP